MSDILIVGVLLFLGLIYIGHKLDGLRDILCKHTRTDSVGIDVFCKVCKKKLTPD